MDFRILGPLEVSDDDGRAVEIPVGQRRTILIDLLLHANEVVSDERLIDDLWGGRPPATAQKILQLHISSLRKRLGSDRITRIPPGYVLRTEPGELDADRVRAAGGDSARPEALREALAEWRGRPLIDVEFEEFARAEVERLDELRLSLLERLFAAELELGRHAEVVPDLEALVAAEPLRERARATLMLALYRSGRHADALDRYRTGRTVLGEQLGLEPSRELRQLEQQILAQDPALAVTPASRSPQRRRAYATIAVAVGLAAGVVAGILLLARSSMRVVPLANSALLISHGGDYTRDALVGAAPRLVAVSAGALFTANFGDSTVTRVDLRAHRVSSVGLGSPPTALTVGAGGVWVASSFSQTLVRLDPATGAVAGTVVLDQPVDALTAGAGAVWAVNEENGILTRVDPTTLHPSRYPLRLHGPSGIVADDRGALWIAESFSRQLVRLDPTTGSRRTIPLTLTPDAVGEGCGAVWLTNPADNEVTQVDEQSLAQRLIAVGVNPIGVAAAGSTAWVANDLSHALDEIDCRHGTVIRTLTLSSNLQPHQPKLTPRGIAVLPNGGAWVGIDSWGRG